jgi:phage shock protein E
MKQLIVDVREPDEYASGHVKGALNVPPVELMSGSKVISNIPKDTKIIVYCRTGSRSNVAMHILQQQGFTNVINGINKEQVEARFL